MSGRTILSEGAARRVLGRFATEKVPTCLLVEIARYFKFDRSFNDGVRFGILGAKEEGVAEKKIIASCVVKLEKLLAEVRFEFPFLSIREWYMVSLSCYESGDLDLIDRIKEGKTQENKKFITQRLVSDFSKKVCEARIW